MKPISCKKNFSLIVKLGLSSLLLFFLLSNQVAAQSPPGISGGVPSRKPNIGTSNLRYVQLSGVDPYTQSVQQTLPLNGILNYVFYYQPLSNSDDPSSPPGFIPSGNYIMRLLN